jgi:hypothetical protein
MQVENIFFSIANVYDANNAVTRTQLWDLMHNNLPIDEWTIDGDMNMTETQANATVIFLFLRNDDKASNLKGFKT